MIAETLGKALTPSDLAKILGCQTSFVRRHYIELGGIRLGPKKIVFFEPDSQMIVGDKLVPPTNNCRAGGRRQPFPE